jgi:hypothetical protein
MREFVATIEAVVPAAAGSITFEDVQLPFPEEFVAGVHPSPVTPLEQGVRETAAAFREPS